VHFLAVSQLDRKSMLAIMGGDPPDVLGPWAPNVPPFAEAGALLPLDDFMKQSGLTADHYIKNYFSLGTWKGRVYALPTSPSCTALFYNKEHFRKKADQLRAAGLDPDRAPLTIEELDRYAEVLNEFNSDGSPRIMGFLPTEPGWFNEYWGYFFGGRLYDEETGEITADDPGNVRVFEWLKTYAETYGSESLLRFRSGFGSFDSPQNAFLDDKVSMELQGVWFPNFIRRHRPQMEFGVAHFPVPEGVPDPRGVIDADVICIPRGCKHIEEAWKFIHFVQTDGLPILCRLQGKHLPLKDPPAWFYEGHPNLELRVFEEAAASPYSFSFPRIDIRDEYAHEIGKAFEHFWNWQPPQASLVGLAQVERKEKSKQLIREEILRTLQDIDKRMQVKIDQSRERSLLRNRS